MHIKFFCTFNNTEYSGNKCGRRKAVLEIIGKGQHQNIARILSGSRNFTFAGTSHIWTGKAFSLPPMAVPPKHNVTPYNACLLY